MSETRKTRTTPRNVDGDRWVVKGYLEAAIELRENDIKILRQLTEQIDRASPDLVQEFASEARQYRLSGGLMAYQLGYDDYIISLDAFLSYRLTKEAFRRRRTPLAASE